MRRFLLSIQLLLALVACGGDPTIPPEGYKQIDVNATQRAYFTANPNARAVGLFDRFADGFVFGREGRVAYVPFGAKSDLLTETKVTSMQGNRICVDKSGSWSGACMHIFESANGRYRVQGNFGNGADFSYDATLVPFEFE